MAAVQHKPWGPIQVARFLWTVVSIFVVESLVVGIAALPAVAFFDWHSSLDLSPSWLRIMILSMSLIPAYVIFSVVLMVCSAVAMRLLGWRPPREANLEIAELPVELCNWARYMISTYLVRTLVGPFTQATFVWTWYMRMNGARIGRRVWVNSLGVTDHCNLEIGDDVVIGAGVHMSAHTVERGVVRIAPIRIGSRTTVGLNSHIQIGAIIGDRCQVGSMSLVPKFAHLDEPGTWVGIPVKHVRGLKSGTKASNG